MMKRTLFLTALVCAALGAVFAQNQFPDIEKYADLYMGQFVTDMDWRKAELALKNPALNEKYASLGGNAAYIDTALEASLHQYYESNTPVPPEAEAILPHSNPRLVDRQLGAAVYKEMQVLRFLGNTAAVGRHEGIIKFITDRGNVTEADIKNFMAQGIAAAVDAEFNKVSFTLDVRGKGSYHTILTRDARTGQYTLSYERPSVANDDKEITAPNLNALKAEMRKEFDEASINTVEAKAALIPAIVFDGWKRTTPNMVNPYELLTNALTDFYKEPSRRNYEIVRGILARAVLASVTDGDAFTDRMTESIHGILVAFNLNDKMNEDIDTTSKMRAAANIPDDPRYGIFTLTKVSGDEIFVSKRKSAPGLLVR